MRLFQYDKLNQELFSPEIMNLISAIHEYKGKQDLYIEAHADSLVALLEVAKIQSTGASNRIEGIFTSDERLKELVAKRVEPRNRSEEEIAGYREVLATIHENYDYIPTRPNIILQFHRDLYSYSPSSIGGSWKNADNVIEEIGPDGDTKIRFTPLSAFETPRAVEALCNTYIAAVESGKYDPLLLITVFILDFLCIHPFHDGNGRMSRLLTLLLLYRVGYIVGKYISIEYLIEQSKETYYDVMQESSQNWYEGTNTPSAFVKYYLGILLKAYKEFSTRVEHLTLRNTSKPARIRKLFADRLGRISKKDILETFPDISMSTVEITLSELLKEGKIIKTGSGKLTAYVRKET